MMPLPSGNFFWHENPEEFMKQNPWKNWIHDSKNGYFLEVLYITNILIYNSLIYLSDF